MDVLGHCTFMSLQTFTKKVHCENHIHPSHKQKQTKEPPDFPDFITYKVQLISLLWHLVRDRVMLWKTCEKSLLAVLHHFIISVNRPQATNIPVNSYKYSMQPTKIKTSVLGSFIILTRTLNYKKILLKSGLTIPLILTQSCKRQTWRTGWAKTVWQKHSKSILKS